MPSFAMRRCLVVVSFALALLSAVARPQPQHNQTPLPRITARAKSRFLYDEHGRVRIFHGVNGVHKGFPWYPQWYLQNDTIIDEIVNMGLNAVRVGWMFTGLMPEEGVVNHTYYEKSLEVVQKLASRGIHSLLDAHQDCLSTKFCLYDGWPRWVIDRSVPDQPFPWPFKGNCSTRAWGSNELTDAAGKAYQDIYDNNHGMRDAFAEFWSQSAQMWRGNSNVLGYELMNEPFAGDVYKDPALFLPGEAGQKNLQPFYDAIAKTLRAHDDTTLVFYEPVTWGMVFDGKVFGSGFSTVPGGSEYANRSVFSFHLYCNSFGGDRKICDPIVSPLVFEAIEQDVAGLGGASFLTEWGSCDSARLGECVFMAGLADKHLQSWTEWSGFGQDAMGPSAAEKQVLTRAYTRAFAGQPINVTFDDTSLAFESCWVVDASIAAPTEVFVPFNLKYGGSPAGAKVTSTSNVAFKVDATSQVILLSPASSQVDGQTACVFVSKA